jgi:hypothetical protein
MGQGMGHGISTSKGTAASFNQFKTVACSDFNNGDVVPHSEDNGQTTEHYRPVLRAALAKKRTCKRTGQSMRQPKPKKKAGESGRQFKIRKRAEKRKAKAAEEQQRQQEMEDEVVREMERERAQDSSSNEGSQGMSKTEMAAYGAAAAAAGISLAEYIKRQQRRQGQRGRFGQAAIAAQNVRNPNPYTRVRPTSPGRRRY